MEVTLTLIGLIEVTLALIGLLDVTPCSNSGLLEVTFWFFVESVFHFQLLLSVCLQIYQPSVWNLLVMQASVPLLWDIMVFMCVDLRLCL